MNSPELPDIFLPPVNKTMKDLDRSFFQKMVPISAATIFDTKNISRVRTTVTSSKELLSIFGIKPVIDDESIPDTKCILLIPEVKPEEPKTWSQPLAQLVNDNVIRIKPHNLHMTYDHWTMHNILEAVLPDLPEDQKETPTGFAQAGHIAHLNLRNQYLPYQALIAQVLIDKNPTIRTVINKTLDVGSESEFRTFPYEVLAGDNDLEVTASEQGCEFRFNFAEVYWNSRLSHEHERIVSKFTPGEAVCDAMAGVGPFAVPAGKRKVFVRANDLNPHSFTGLEWSIWRNKVEGFVTASCSDARHFIRDATRQLARSPRTYEHMPNIRIPRNANPMVQMAVATKRLRATVKYQEPRIFNHYVMNLPATAVEFLNVFRGLFVGREEEFDLSPSTNDANKQQPNASTVSTPSSRPKLPMIHVYTFQTKQPTALEESQAVCAKISHYLGHTISVHDQDVDICDVRLVSPKKKFYCASFRLPAEVAFAEPEWISRTAAMGFSTSNEAMSDEERHSGGRRRNSNRSRSRSKEEAD